MKESGGSSAGAWSSWLSPLFACCSSRAVSGGEKQLEDDEKSQHLVCDQPGLQSRPVLYSHTPHKQGGKRSRLPSSTSNGSGRRSVSPRRRFKSDSTPRRPLISAPSDFRHVNSGSFQFPPPEPQPRYRVPHRSISEPIRTSSFQPLELEIYKAQQQLSPILPHFELRSILATPPPAYVPRMREDGHELVSQGSYTSFSFHVPRRPLASQSPLSTDRTISSTPAPLRPARARAYTSPEVDTLKEKVASAMIEMERLQKQIDDVIERQSLFNTSRPSTPGSMALAMSDMEPMPSIPALPPSAPSFAQRLNSEAERPQTAPMQIHGAIRQSPTYPKRVTPPSPQQYSPVTPDSQLPPPLPLVLRPPLRKKKSFSRVSSWLFQSTEHSRHTSFDSVTNRPQPVKGGQGYYQCVHPSETSARQSVGSTKSSSSWGTDEEQTTLPTTWSPQSTPATGKDDSPIERVGTFGKAHTRSGPSKHSLTASQ